MLSCVALEGFIKTEVLAKTASATDENLRQAAAGASMQAAAPEQSQCYCYCKGSRQAQPPLVAGAGAS
jgi:hypothetical protein